MALMPLLLEGGVAAGEGWEGRSRESPLRRERGGLGGRRLRFKESPLRSKERGLGGSISASDEACRGGDGESCRAGGAGRMMRLGWGPRRAAHVDLSLSLVMMTMRRSVGGSEEE